jgi:hypothetical protein
MENGRITAGVAGERSASTGAGENPAPPRKSDSAATPQARFNPAATMAVPEIPSTPMPTKPASTQPSKAPAVFAAYRTPPPERAPGSDACTTKGNVRPMAMLGTSNRIVASA